MTRLMRGGILFVLSLLGACSVSSPSLAAEWEKYEVTSVSASLSTTQAGAHADFTSSFALANDHGQPFALTRDIAVHVPPGVIGNPQGIPRCSIEQLGEEPSESECPLDSQVGISEVELGGKNLGTFTEPVYNMDPPGGDTVARFGVYAGPYPAVINVTVDPIDYSLVATVEGASAAAALVGAKTTLWGVPAAPSHDALRLTPLEAFNGEAPPGGRKAGLPPAPFISNPTSCTTDRQISVTATSYQIPSAPSTKAAPFPKITGCGVLGFEPKFSALPTSTEAASATGLDATLVIPQNETPNGIATSTVRSASVSLPAGMTINPAAGDGLQACSSDQVGFGRDEESHCPDAAKLGSIEVEVPALEKTLNGSVYQRSPEPGHLFRLWVVTDEQGVHLKLPAEIQPNRTNGQVTTLFLGIPTLDGLPQLPFSELRLHVDGGPRAPLSTPGTCGTYQTHFEFTPWSGKEPTVGDTPMQITSGCNKGGFSPLLSAGTLNPTAGSYSPFALTLTRQDGEGNPQLLEVTLPKGLIAKFAGVPECPEAAMGDGSCPASSQIGTLAAAAGVGGAPLWIPQPGKAPTAVYLAGPYKGAPFSILAKVPAQAGPFDLGTVLNRSAIFVDPETATGTITTDPLPQILEGVPVAYREIHVDVNRPGFTLNPTSCSAKQIQARVVASDGASATPVAPFQATNCANLGFKPKLTLSFKGGHRRTKHPALKSVLTFPKSGDWANIAKAAVTLPGSEFIDQGHIGNPCTRPQFAAQSCPKLSVLGRAKAWTPLLDQPLEGKVYFRSNGGERELPDVVADLRGQIHVVLIGAVDTETPKTDPRIRTTFFSVPDAPVSRFQLELKGGKEGLLVNSEDICKAPQRAVIRFTGQNGKVRNTEPKIANSCGGKKR